MATGLLLLATLALAAARAPWSAHSHHPAVLNNSAVCRSVKVVPVGWFDGRNMGPASINSLAELESLGKHVAPVLYGGLGNQLFQLAALHVYARSVGVPCVVGWFDHWNRKISNSFEPWGGHPPPAPGITIKDTFPAIRYFTMVPSITPATVLNDYAFALKEPGQYLPLPPKERLPAQIHGYFFNVDYFHHDRAYLLNLFKLNPAIEEYIDAFYNDIWASPLETVSLHLRFGYSGEPATGLLNDRQFPPKSFYNRVFEKEFNRRAVLYVVLADDVKRAEEFMSPLAAYGFHYRIVDDNSVVSLRVMARCRHHVLTSSTLSFWGAYLDEHQPLRGRTILHKTFFTDHGHNIVPYDSWEVYE
eukprot:m.247492 g.247492  ORF g.247492 m.247492 type:complete len:360 (-) comp51358_c0_seq1:23-1102(-)